MENNNLRDTINAHPLLSYPRTERIAHLPERLDLIHLLMRYKRFDTQLEHTLDKTDSFALSAAEMDLNDALYNKKRRTQHFDGVAFTEAALAAINGYDATQGVQFLTYFDRIYGRRLIAQAQAGVNIANSAVCTRFSAKDIQLLKNIANFRAINDYGRKPEYSEGWFQDLADYLEQPVEKVKKLLALLQATDTVESLDRSVSPDGNDDSCLSDLISDETATREMDAFEEKSRIADMFDRLARLDEKEYPRLFMTNDILAPLFQNGGLTDHAGYAALLAKNEPALWSAVFILTYLEFVFLTPPDPDTLCNIFRCRLQHELQDNSIAAYKKVSAAAVSQQRKKYSILQAQYRNYLQDI